MRRRSEFLDTAQTYRDEEKYELAGEYYSLAGYAYVVSTWDTIRTRDIGYLKKGQLLEGFVWQEYAATCYAVSGSSRKQNRAEQGIVGLEDVRETLIQHPAWIGLSWELEGDLRQIGGLSGADDAYATALEQFREVEDTCNDSEILSWTTEPGFNETGLFITELTEGVGAAVELAELRNDDGHPSLTKRLEYKRDQLSRLVDRLTQRGVWELKNRDLPTAEDDMRDEDEIN